MGKQVMGKAWIESVIITGLFVGTTDILLAFLSQYIKTGNFAEKMFLYIAGGATGLEQSMTGGFWTELLGLFFHYFIALSFTALFFYLYPKWKILSYNIYLTGILYAVFVNLVMRYIILPFTPLPSQPFILSRAFIDWITLGIVLGIPIVYFAGKFYSARIDSK
ncbi:MAG: hypothetical protein KDC49_21815 [Saprospiraceae bacterium]|nr:hypothetical protein [Saprospiraceae bacterium]